MNPLAYLGMLTFAVFILLGVTGALLMFYYQPSYAGAWRSVQAINDEIPYGFALRNIHYHASNAMVLLAIAHLFYQFFAGRYKLRFELLWVTGVVLGTLTIIEAYTGYDLILNVRAMLAINIGVALAFSSQPLAGGFPLADLVFAGSSGLDDIILRYYTLHVFIIPIIMLLLMGFHLPRNLTLDIPMVSSVFAIIFIVGGLFPVELGIRFDPKIPTAITFPEWYLTGLYAFIRTGIPAVIAGVIAPTIFILMFLVIPFIDRNVRRLSVWDRPFVTSLGVMALGQILLTTVWGFRHDNIFLPLTTEEGLLIDPVTFFGLNVLIAVISFIGVYLYAGYRRTVKRVSHVRPPAKPGRPMATWEVFTVLGVLILLEIFINMAAMQAYLAGLRNLALIEIGLILLIFAFAFHIFRTRTQLPSVP